MSYLSSHPIITVSDESGLSHCILDFIPLDRKNPSVLTKLAIGASVQGEVRTEYIGTPNRELIDHVNMIVLNWNAQLNIYTNNCHHFKEYVLNTYHSKELKEHNFLDFSN